jgi:hypothetical protein
VEVLARDWPRARLGAQTDQLVSVHPIKELTDRRLPVWSDIHVICGLTPLRKRAPHDARVIYFSIAKELS